MVVLNLILHKVRFVQLFVVMADLKNVVLVTQDPVAARVLVKLFPR